MIRFSLRLRFFFPPTSEIASFLESTPTALE